MFVDTELYQNIPLVDFISKKSHLINYHKMRILSFVHVTKYVYQPATNIQNSSYILQKPFGKMKIDQNGEDLYDSRWIAHKCKSSHLTENVHKYEYHWSFQWKFLLDKHLNINLTFEYIHISIANNFECYIGKIEIKDVHGNNSGFVYCGIHSNMIVYLSLNYINLHLSLRTFVFCQIQLSFAVTDPNRIVSYMRNIYEATNPIWSLYFSATSTFCVKFHLFVKKFKCLKVLFLVKNSFTKEIFDGPGTLSKIIQPHYQNGSEVYMTSTFQCIIYVYYKSRITVQHIVFNSIEIPVKSVVILNRNDINHVNYPNCCRNSSIIAIMIKVKEHFSINFTVSRLITSLKRNTDCNYGGLTSFEESNQGKTELLTVCFNHSFVHGYKHVYSTQASMRLVFYSYPEYGKFNIRIELKSTTCKLVNLNICMNTEFTVTFPESGCIVYQFKHEFDIKVYETYVRCGLLSCSVKLWFNTTLPDSRKIQLHTLGYLQGKGQFDSFVDCNKVCSYLGISKIDRSRKYTF